MFSERRDLAHQPWTHAADGVIVDVRLTPRGGRDAIEGIERRADGRVVLKARVRAAPFEGQANTALCRLLADVLDAAPRQVTPPRRSPRLGPPPPVTARSATPH